MASQPEPLPSVDLRFSPHMASQPEPLPSVDLNPNDAESDEEIDGVYAISPLCHKIAIGLRRYRLFVIKLQQVCRDEGICMLKISLISENEFYLV